MCYPPLNQIVILVFWVYSNVPSSVQFDTQIDTSTHQIVSVEPVDEHRSSDMTLSVSTNGLCLIVHSCVKKQLFRRVKFFHDELHGLYDTKTNSVCGLVMRFCNISAIAAEPRWWFDMKPVIKKLILIIATIVSRPRWHVFVVRNMCYFVINIIFFISQSSIGTEGERGTLTGFANKDGSHKDFV